MFFYSKSLIFINLRVPTKKLKFPTKKTFSSDKKKLRDPTKKTLRSDKKNFEFRQKKLLEKFSDKKNKIFRQKKLRKKIRQKKLAPIRTAHSRRTLFSQRMRNTKLNITRNRTRACFFVRNFPRCRVYPPMAQFLFATFGRQLYRFALFRVKKAYSKKPTQKT